MPWIGHDAIMSDVNGKKLQRTHEGRIVAGVCSGAGQYLGVDPNIIRVAFLVVSIVTVGFGGVLAYLAAWVVIPEEGEQASIVENLISKGLDGSGTSGSSTASGTTGSDTTASETTASGSTASGSTSSGSTSSGSTGSGS